jgi:hypothetical protein
LVARVQSAIGVEDDPTKLSMTEREEKRDSDAIKRMRIIIAIQHHFFILNFIYSYKLSKHFYFIILFFILF